MGSRRTRARRWGSALVAASALALGACGGSESGNDSASTSGTDKGSTQGGGTPAAGSPTGTLKVNFPGLPTSWEPGTSVVAGYLRVPYETLTHVATDGSGEVSPMLATRWKETADSLTLTLRHGVRFHDGTPFDATAVKKNIEYVRDGKGQYAGGLSAIEDIKVLAPDRVELRLSNPTPSLPTTLGGLGVPMTSPKALEAGTLKRAPVGTGPWAYDEKGSIAWT
jgi:peptide/nickel transport system substrate-binding protein